MAKVQGATVTKIQPRTDVEPPKMFKVIFLNDEVTSMEFVVQTLITIFDYDMDRAMETTEKIHTDGSAVIAVYPFEIAEHKGVEVTMLARANQFPLQVKVEPE